MKRKGMLLATLLLFMAATLQAAPPTIPVPLPSITLQISPSNPTSNDAIILALSGLWPDSCPPDAVNVSISGENISVDLLLPGAEDCDEPNCNPVESAYQVTTSIGPLSPGTYNVFARAVACNKVGESEFIGSFDVGFPAGGPGGLTQGACVVLLADNQPGLPGLTAGRNGTIVCSTTDSPLGPFLISWDFYSRGTSDARSCASGIPVYFRPNSATVVDPQVVPLGTCFNECGTITQSGGCIVLQTDGGLTFNLVDTDGWLAAALTTGEIRFGDRARVEGLLSTLGPRPGVSADCPREDGDIHEPVVTLCTPAGGAGCCAADYTAGDRVVLLVDNPAGLEGRRPSNLRAGTEGTVVCCNPNDPSLPVFVSWDGFTGGTDTSSLCNPPIPSFPAGSGWWVSCNDIEPSGGQSCPNDKLTINFGSDGIQINRDPQCTTASRPFSGCVTAAVGTDKAARLSVEITPLSGMDGTWEATITPNEVPAGQSIVQVCVTVTGLDLTKIPAGQNVKVATASLDATPF